MEAKLEQLARAALRRGGLAVRSLAQDLLQETSSFWNLLRPTTKKPRVLAMAAALVELLALRQLLQP